MCPNTSIYYHLKIQPRHPRSISSSDTNYVNNQHGASSFTSFSSWRVLQAAGSLSFCLLFKSPNANTNSKALTILHSRSLNTLLGWKTKYNFGYYTLYKTNCQRCASGVLVKTLQTSQSWAYILHLGYGQCHTTSACLLFIHCLFEPQSVGVYW